MGLAEETRCELVTTGVRLVEVEETAAMLGSKGEAVADRLLYNVEACSSSFAVSLRGGERGLLGGTRNC